MPFTPYIASQEYALYGIPDANASQVAAACRAVNSYLVRPEGLLWSPDANGAPAYMTNLNPTLSFTGSALAPGTSVVITVAHAQFGYQNIGEVVILDRSTVNITEACVVTAASGNTLTLANVQFTHPAPTIDFGLTLLEESPLIPGKTVVRTARAPLAQVLSGFTRYGFGRRQITDSSMDCQVLLNQAIPPGWTQIDLTQCDINFSTGVILVPPYYLQHPQLDARFRYVAGWSQANLPGDIKQAVANIVRGGIDYAPGGNIKTLKTGDGTIEFFSPGSIDADAKSLLQPYKTVRI